MSFIQYLWAVLCLACTSAWGISGVIAQIISIVIGIVIWKRPTREPAMKHLPWLIPLGVFVVWLLIMLIIAPYQIVENQKDTITKLHDALPQKATDTKQDMRTLLESINPEIIQRIDAGQKEIHTLISIPTHIKLLELSKRPDFDKFLSFRETHEVSINSAPPPNCIEELNASYVEGYYLYPKDALIKGN